MDFYIKMSEKEYENFQRDIIPLLVVNENKTRNQSWKELRDVLEYYGIKFI